TRNTSPARPRRNSQTCPSHCPTFSLPRRRCRRRCCKAGSRTYLPGEATVARAVSITAGRRRSSRNRDISVFIFVSIFIHIVSGNGFWRQRPWRGEEIELQRSTVSREQHQSRVGDGEALEIAISPSSSSSQSPSTWSPATASGGDGHDREGD
ncbi:hypothetical protein TIFTF001_051565, partial [Ficus carica]